MGVGSLNDQQSLSFPLTLFEGSPQFFPFCGVVLVMPQNACFGLLFGFSSHRGPCPQFSANLFFLIAIIFAHGV